MQPDQLLRLVSSRIAEGYGRAPARRPRRARARRRAARLQAPTGGTRPRHAFRVTAVLGHLRKLLAATASAVRAAWRMNADVQRALAESQRPWEREGPLRWQGRGHHAQLVGAHLPGAEPCGAGSASHTGAGGTAPDGRFG